MLLPTCLSFGLPVSPVCLSVSQTSTDDSGRNGNTGQLLNSRVLGKFHPIVHHGRAWGTENAEILHAICYRLPENAFFQCKLRCQSNQSYFLLKKKFDVTNGRNGFSNIQNCHQVIMYLFNTLAESCTLFWKCS